MRIEKRSDGREDTRARMRLSRWNIRGYGNIVGDYAPVHRKRKAARECELVDTPIIGTHLAAIALQLAYASGELGGSFCQKMKFEKPILPKREIRWYRGKEEGLVIKAEQRGELRATFSYTSQESESDTTHSQPWCVYDSEISERNIKKMKKLTGGSSLEIARHALGYALIPAALTEIIQKRDGPLVALHRSSVVRHDQPIVPGAVHIRLYEPRCKNYRDSWIYTIEGEAVQEKTKVRATMICITKREMNLDAIRDKVT